MSEVLLSIPYLVAAVLFILSLRGLSSQETAQRGNLYGILGMAIAVAATLTADQLDNYPLVIGTIVVGSAIGLWLAARVAMTAMPELVALLHSFVGAAAVLVGFATYVSSTHEEVGVGRAIHMTEVYVAVWIGAVTFTGSVIAFLKLRGTMSGKPLLLPGRHLLNLAAVVASVWLGAVVIGAEGTDGQVALLIACGIALLVGVHMVMAIGGADMPVVVSLLNSYSGWTAAAAGFMLSNDLLIVTGALVGSSGAILSYIMCKAMNRSIVNVVFGGFGTDAAKAPAGEAQAVEGEITETSVDEVARELSGAKSVIIVPGYGMAVARAQHAVERATKALRDKGVDVRFAIHPVAGRLPGHMNVLLAEANISYDIVLEMDDINEDFPETDVVLVIGANDIVNPSAQTDPASPIAGMPVLEAWKARRVVMLKRGRSAGYAGVDNPLFYKENTRMLFGDANDSMNALVGAIAS